MSKPLITYPTNPTKKGNVYSADVLFLMLDHVGVKKLLELRDPMYQRQSIYWYLADFFEEGTLLLHKYLGSSQNFFIFAYGDTICAYYCLPWLEPEDELSIEDFTDDFLKAAVAVFADLIERGYLVRGYLARGDMADLNLLNINSQQVHLATFLGTALLQAVELDKRSIKCAGLFATESTATELKFRTIRNANLKCRKGPKVVLLDMTAYLSSEGHKKFVERLAELAEDKLSRMYSCVAPYDSQDVKNEGTSYLENLLTNLRKSKKGKV